MSERKSGGFHFCDVDGDVTMKAGADLVAGDKITTTHAGFRDQTQKDEFLMQMDALRSALREIKSRIEPLDQFEDDAKEELVMEILHQVSELKQAKHDAEQLGPMQSPHEKTLQAISRCLDRAGGLLHKIKVIGDSAVGITEGIAPILATTLPILASARHLLGVP